MQHAKCSSIYKYIDKNELQAILKQFQSYIYNLILFHLGELKEDQIDEVNLTYIENFKAHADIEPAVKIINHYIDIIATITENNHISRLATLRAITAIGEAFKKIQKLVPDICKRTFQTIINLRDYIVHSSTYEAFNYTDDLIYKENTIIFNVLQEIKNMKEFISELNAFFGNTESYPNDFHFHMPILNNTMKLEIEYSKYLKNADKTVRLSHAEYESLKKSIPIENLIVNPDYDIIENFIKKGTRLDRDKFVEICIGYDNVAQTKKVHGKIKEINKIKNIFTKANEIDFNFSEISLNLSKNDNKILEKIQQEKNLENLLDFLKNQLKFKRQDFNEDAFLEKQKNVDIRKYKNMLESFLMEKYQTTKENFSRSVKIVFGKDADFQKIWLHAYCKCIYGENKFIKRDVLTKLKYSIEKINQLKKVASLIFFDNNLDIFKDHVASLAREMLYCFCSNSFKCISNYITQLHDYNDKLLYIDNKIYSHPIKELKDILDTRIEIRNEIFHFNTIFDKRCDGNIINVRNWWFYSLIQELIYGKYYPNGICMTPDSVCEKPIFDDYKLNMILNFTDFLEKDLARDENNFNMYELCKLEGINILTVQMSKLSLSD